MKETYPKKKNLESDYVDFGFGRFDDGLEED